MTQKPCPFVTFLAVVALLALGIAALVAAPGVAQAQSLAGAYNPTYASEQFAGVWGGYGYHSSTAAEGYARGVAAIIRSQGDYNLKTAHANILQEEARSRHYDNVIKRTETYWERKAIYQQETALRRLARKERREAGRALLEERRANEYRLAYQLTPREYNAKTGQIHWPASLAGARFGQQCAELDRLFAQVAEYGSSVPVGTTDRIVTLVRQIKHDLQNQHDGFSRSEYRAAARFLTGLQYEAQFPRNLS